MVKIIFYHHFDNLSLNFVLNIPEKEKDMDMENLFHEKSKKLTSNIMKSDLGNGNDSLFNAGTKSSIYCGKTIKSRNSTTRLSSMNATPLAFEKFIKNISVSEVGNSSIFDAIDKMDYKTLDQQFLNSEDIIARALKTKHKPTTAKPITIDNSKQIDKIFCFDQETKTRKFVEWSGEDVLNFLPKEENHSIFNRIMNNLENLNIIIWPYK